MDKIKQLFALRDEAVKKNDSSLFSSTQLEEIEGSTLDGYLALEKLKSEVLCIYPKSTQEASKKVFVRETYYQKDMQPRHAFLIYYLVNTGKGWKIYQIIY